MKCSFCESEVSSARAKKFCPSDINTHEYDICEFCYTSVPPWVMSKAVPYQKKSDDVILNIWLAAASAANYRDRRFEEQVEELVEGFLEARNG